MPTPTPHPRPSAHADKAQWRRWAHAQRDALRAADPAREADRRAAAHLRAWEPWRRARVALVYLAFGSELDPLLDALAAPPRGVSGAAGPLLATTRTPPGGRGTLSVHALTPETLERHPYGFSQPRADAATLPLERIDVVLVPGLCFDERGTRLGYGRGYYDRLLPQLPRHARRLGVTLDALVVPQLPSEPHDARVDALLSESGVRPTAS